MSHPRGGGPKPLMSLMDLPPSERLGSGSQDATRGFRGGGFGPRGRGNGPPPQEGSQGSRYGDASFRGRGHPQTQPEFGVRFQNDTPGRGHFGPRGIGREDTQGFARGRGGQGRPPHNASPSFQDPTSQGRGSFGPRGGGRGHSPGFGQDPNNPFQDPSQRGRGHFGPPRGGGRSFDHREDGFGEGQDHLDSPSNNNYNFQDRGRGPFGPPRGRGRGFPNQGGRGGGQGQDPVHSPPNNNFQDVSNRGRGQFGPPRGSGRDHSNSEDHSPGPGFGRGRGGPGQGRPQTNNSFDDNSFQSSNNRGRGHPNDAFGSRVGQGPSQGWQDNFNDSPSDNFQDFSNRGRGHFGLRGAARGNHEESPGQNFGFGRGRGGHVQGRPNEEMNSQRGGRGAFTPNSRPNNFGADNKNFQSPQIKDEPGTFIRGPRVSRFGPPIDADEMSKEIKNEFPNSSTIECVPCRSTFSNDAAYRTHLMSEFHQSKAETYIPPTKMFKEESKFEKKIETKPFSQTQSGGFPQAGPSGSSMKDEAKPIPDFDYQPNFDDSYVILDWYDSDLNLDIDTNGFCSAKAISEEGFGYIWAGVRATYGTTAGKVCFEVSVDGNADIAHLDVEPNPNVLRVGWSLSEGGLNLGEESLSYGFGGTGMKSTNRKFTKYGQSYGVGDVVGCYLDCTTDPIKISFSVNGFNCGVAFSVTKSELKGRPLFPHVYTKNQHFSVNFGQMPSPLKQLIPGFRPIGQLDVSEGLVRGSVAPPTKKDCEVLMMVGLPGAGKTYWVDNWVKQHPEKKYNVLGTNTYIEKMKVMNLTRWRNYHGRWEVLIQSCTKCFDRILQVACNRRRNFIIDQTNVYPTARGRKLSEFGGYNCKAVVVVPPLPEYLARCELRAKEEGKDVPEEAVLNMKANFVLPDIEESFSDVIYTDLPPHEASLVIQEFNKEAMSRGSTMNPGVRKFLTRNEQARSRKGIKHTLGRLIENPLPPIKGSAQAGVGPNRNPMAPSTSQSNQTEFSNPPPNHWQNKNTPNNSFGSNDNWSNRSNQFQTNKPPPESDREFGGPKLDWGGKNQGWEGTQNNQPNKFVAGTGNHSRFGSDKDNSTPNRFRQQSQTFTPNNSRGPPTQPDTTPPNWSGQNRQQTGSLSNQQQTGSFSNQHQQRTNQEPRDIWGSSQQGDNTPAGRFQGSRGHPSTPGGTRFPPRPDASNPSNTPQGITPQGPRPVNPQGNSWNQNWTSPSSQPHSAALSHPFDEQDDNGPQWGGARNNPGPGQDRATKRPFPGGQSDVVPPKVGNFSGAQVGFLPGPQPGQSAMTQPSFPGMGVPVMAPAMGQVMGEVPLGQTGQQPPDFNALMDYLRYYQSQMNNYQMGGGN